MTIQECYQVLGGDYAQVEKRLPGIHLIRRFIAKFLDDGSYPELCRAMEQGQTEEAFRAAHTLKGVSANLGFDRLMVSSGELTELLRGRTDSIPTEAVPLLDMVRQDYELTADAIRAYLNSDGQA